MEYIVLNEQLLDDEVEKKDCFTCDGFNGKERKIIENERKDCFTCNGFNGKEWKKTKNIE